MTAKRIVWLRCSTPTKQLSQCDFTYADGLFQPGMFICIVNTMQKYLAEHSMKYLSHQAATDAKRLQTEWACRWEPAQCMTSCNCFWSLQILNTLGDVQWFWSLQEHQAICDCHPRTTKNKTWTCPKTWGISSYRQRQVPKNDCYECEFKVVTWLWRRQSSTIDSDVAVDSIRYNFPKCFVFEVYKYACMQFSSMYVFGGFVFNMPFILLL